MEVIEGGYWDQLNNLIIFAFDMVKDLSKVIEQYINIYSSK